MQTTLTFWVCLFGTLCPVEESPMGGPIMRTYDTRLNCEFAAALQTSQGGAANPQPWTYIPRHTCEPEGKDL